MITAQSALTDSLSAVVLATAGLRLAQSNPDPEDLENHRRAIQEATDRRDALLATADVDLDQAKIDSATYLDQVEESLSAAVEKWRPFVETPDLARLLYPDTDTGGQDGARKHSDSVAALDSIQFARISLEDS